MPRPLFRKFMYASTFGICMTVGASAQTVTSSVGGTVTDASAALISGAKVTASNVDTGVATSAITNASGTYSIRFLQIGSYKVTVEAPGFSQAVFGPYKLEIDQIARIDAHLTVGSENQTMTVTDQMTPILNTDNSQIDTTFDQNTIQNIPLNSANFSALMQYMPGAVAVQPSSFQNIGAVERDTGASGIISVNGNRLQTNNYLWDGVEINETINNLIGYSPSPEAIGEIKVVAANPNAEYGNANGGDVIMQMKSGTNHIHGSTYGFVQDQDLNANSWTNKHNSSAASPAAPINKFTQSIFGGSIGGPLLHDKLFYFADFAAGRLHSGNNQKLYVISAKMRQGDFSELLDPAIMCSDQPANTPCANTIQLYDSFNNNAAYVGNQNIPINNPVAKYLFAHPEVYPLPNHAPDPDTATSENLYGVAETFNAYNQGDLRVDYTLSPKDSLFAHYTQAEGFDGTSAYPVAAFFQNGSKYPDKVIAFGNVHTFSSSLVNEFRAGFSRIRWLQGDPVDTSGLFGTHGDSTVGICNGCSQPFQGFAAQNISGLNTPGNPAGGTNFIDNTFHYTEALTWEHGHHNSKFGVEFIRYQQNNFYPGNDGALGNFTYNGNFTSNPNLSNAQGFGAADFVLDRVYRTAIGGVTGRTGQRQWRTAYYAQDDWRVSPKLTLNIGLRYEYDQPIFEVNNKEANVDFATGQAVLAGVNGNSRSLYNATYNNLMPRVGFAYSATPRLVVRGGYGITTYLEGTGANLRLTYNPPFQPSFEVTGTAPTTNSPGQFFLVENGFNASATPNYSGTTYRAWHNVKPAVVNTFSLSTQFQINNQSSLTVAYVGETGSHLIQAVAGNQLVKPCVIGGVFQPNPNSTACTAADPAPFQALVGQSGSVVETATEGMYNYNSLQLQYRQRPIAGLEYTVNYAYGHAFTNSSGFFGDTNVNGPSPYAQNAYDNSSEYGPTGTDIRHNANGTAVYDLPVGRGKRFGGNMPYMLDEAVGGWKISIAAVAYSGFPLTPNSNYNNAGTNNRAIRPNQYFKLHIVNKSVDHWFGTDPTATGCSDAGGTVNALGALCAYGSDNLGQYGTARANSLRAPGYQNYDASVSKDFRVFRENKVGFRVDAFNFLNHASLGNPDNTVTDSNFGQITNTRSTERHLQLSASYHF